LKNRLIIAVIIALFASQATAQILHGSRTIRKFWPEGEKRTYRFMVDTVEVGRLEAIMDNIDRQGNCSIEEDLALDLSRQERGFTISVTGRLDIKSTGLFSSSDLKIRLDSREERIRSEYYAPDGKIDIRRGDEDQVSRLVSAPEAVYALDNFMIHQWELALGVQDLPPGETIIIPGFSIQGTYVTDYEFLVAGKVQVQYGAFRDSVWQVDMVRPARSSLYIDRSHRIVKVFDPDRELSAEIVIDPFAKRRAPSKSLLEHVNDQMVRLPIYGLYFFVSLIWLLFLGRDSYRIKWSYLLFIAGGLVYPIIYITQAPLQKSYALNVLGPALGAGESILIPAIIPPLLTGLIQESLKLIPLFLVVRMAKPRPVAMVSMGAFVGAGFGCIEACHLIAPLFQNQQITGYVLIERVFTILFHATAGALLGYGIARKQIWQFLLAAIGLHTLGNYMIIFVQMKTLTIKGLNILLGLYDIALLAGMIYLQRDFKQLQLSMKKAKR
jgi:hypothetical protein